MAGAGPRWWQRGGIYQIYPRSFADSDGDGIGDLPGIIAHLDHIAALGVEALWLSPIYPSPMADFGYDVADYCDVNPLFGTLADFDRLLAEAHAKGLKVIVDWVPNHSSDRHAWFLESRASRDSPKRDWYVWRDGKPDGGPPNGWVSNFEAVGPAWSFDAATGQWYLHSFMAEQPDLNWDNPAVRAAMHDTLRFWLDRGVDGFRIDVVHALAKDPELAESEPHRAHHQDWWPTIHDRLREIRAVIEEYDDRMIVGEVYLLDLERLVEYVNSGDQLHLAHNFVFLNLPWDARAFRSSIDQFEALAADAAWPAWFLSNHDHPRVASRFGEFDGQQRARAIALMLWTLRGTPFIYQGEELGLFDARVPLDAVVDVDGRDPERAPIPWRAPSEAGPGAGFTTGTPWLPLPPDAEEHNVERESSDPGSALALNRRLARLRSETPALQAGAQHSLDAGRGVLAWVRELDGERWLVAVNFLSQPSALQLSPAPRGEAQLVLSSDPSRAEGPLELARTELAPLEAVLVRLG